MNFCSTSQKSGTILFHGNSNLCINYYTHRLNTPLLSNLWITADATWHPVPPFWTVKSLTPSQAIKIAICKHINSHNSALLFKFWAINFKSVRSKIWKLFIFFEKMFMFSKPSIHCLCQEKLIDIALKFSKFLKFTYRDDQPTIHFSLIRSSFVLIVSVLIKI